jgi:hypothetical protein
METQQAQPVLTGKEGKEFDLNLAISWTKNHRDKHPGDPESHFFGKEILQQLLAQEACVGLRFYNAHSKPLNGWQRSIISLSKFITKVVGNVDGDKHLIITGATSDGKDQISKPLGDPLSKTELKDVTATKRYMVAQESVPCPGSPQCPKGLLAGS